MFENVFLICDKYELFAFLCETQKWPLIHIVDPYIFYFYFRDFAFMLAMIWAWEFIETTISLSGKQAMFYTGDGEPLIPETAGDSITGDGTNGLIGLFLCQFLTWYMQTPHIMPLEFPGRDWKMFMRWIKYFVQLFGYVWPTILVADEIPQIGSLGYYIYMGWMPIWATICEIWNSKDDLYYYQTTYVKDANGRMGRRVDYIPYADQAEAHARLHLHFLIIFGFIFFFMITFIYDYTTVFVMAQIHGWSCVLLFWAVFISYKLHESMGYYLPRKYEQIPFFAYTIRK